MWFYMWNWLGVSSDCLPCCLDVVKEMWGLPLSVVTYTWFRTEKEIKEVFLLLVSCENFISFILSL